MEVEVPSYQVFINHRGPDTKYTLAALIYQDLKAAGVEVFLDENELHTGDPFPDAIKGAITSSYVHIAIFSPRYAESTWCLEELCWMLKRRSETKFIPIFYQVEPWVLRHSEQGTYANAFTDLHKKHGVEDQVLVKWRRALEEASGITGEKFDPEVGPRSIVEIAGEVVNMVLEEVRIKKPLEVAEYPVGLEQAAAEFQNTISEYKGNGTIAVGIVGAGGSGKSTLVKHLYNMKRSEFQRSYLLSMASPQHEEDFGSSKSRLLNPHEEDFGSMQRRLLNHRHLHIEVPSNETSLLRLLGDHLRGSHQVLIILDELYNSNQIQSLSSLKGMLGDKSMVIVTSHDKDLLTRFQVNKLYDIRPLDDRNARYLFCQHAFGQPKPLSGLEKSVQDVLQFCGGLPRALEFLGRDFCGVTVRSSWAEKWRRLNRQLPHDTKKILNDSYMSLDPTEREVFLDAAHFLEGEDTDLVKTVLDGLDNGDGWDDLRRLEQKCLVRFENVPENFYDESKHGKCPQSEDIYTDQWRKPKMCLIMNRVLKELAREKAREEFDSQPLGKPLRLSWADNRRNSLQLGHSSNVRGIRISKSSQKPGSAEIRGLKLLVLEDSEPPFRTLSGDLVWLRLHNYRRNQVLSGHSLENLRVMELKGVPYENLSIAPDDEPPLELRELTVDFQENSESAPGSSSTRSILRLSSRFDENPTGHFLLCGLRLLFGELRNLVKLVWKNVKGLEFFPVKLESLRELRHLDLSGWSDLKNLPAFTSLLHLQYLALKDCSKLATVEFGGISKIEYLDFQGCGKLQRLPQGVTTQRSLRYLNLVGTEVQYLPPDLDELRNLEKLFIGSPHLKTLPVKLNNMVHLTELSLIGCSSLYSISKSIERLTRLEILRIRDSGVKILSEGIPWTKMKDLDVVNCPIERLDIGRHGGGMIDQNDLSSLKRLSIRGTNISMISIPDRLCPNIEVIDLSENSKLKVVEGVPGKLTRLNLIDCPKLNRVTCLSKLEQFPNISGCGELKVLHVQDAAGCWKVENIQGSGQLQA